MLCNGCSQSTRECSFNGFPYIIKDSIVPGLPVTSRKFPHGLLYDNLRLLSYRTAYFRNRMDYYTRIFVCKSVARRFNRSRTREPGFDHRSVLPRRIVYDTTRVTYWYLGIEVA